MINNKTSAGLVRCFSPSGKHSVWTVTIVVIASGRMAWSADPPNNREIVAALEKRQSHFASFEFKCSLDLVVQAETLRSNDPFDVSSVHEQELSNEVVFSFSAGKLSYTKHGDSWDGVTGRVITASRRKAFNGRCTKSLFEVGRSGLGTVESGKSPSQILTRDHELVPFGLSTRPTATLNQLGYRLDDLTVSKVARSQDTDEFVKLSIPSWNTRQSEVIVDPSRGYLPLAFGEILGGTVIFESFIDYAESAKGDWIPKVFRSSSLHPDGSTDRTWRWKVLSYSVNEPISDDVFECEFPIGTHVKEKGPDDRKILYEVGPDGKQRPLKEEEYGRFYEAHTKSNP